jgi:hypothetical protein
MYAICPKKAEGVTYSLTELDSKKGDLPRSFY